MSALGTSFSSLWLRLLNQILGPGKFQDSARYDARGRRLPDGGCLRGLLWAFLIEGAAVTTVTLLVFALESLRL